MFKKILIFILVVVILAAGSIFYILNSAKVTQKIVPYVFEKFVKDIKISKLSIEKQSFDFSAAFNVSNLELQVLIGEDKYDITADSLGIKKPGLFSFSKNKISVSLRSLTLFSKEIVIKNANVDCDSVEPFPEMVPVKGDLVIDSIKYLGYTVKDIKGELVADLKSCIIDNFHAQLYGGTLSGEGVIDYKEDLRYSIKVDLEDIDLKKLEQVQPGVASNVKGIVDGTVEISGKINGDNVIKGSIWAVKDGEIKAALLKLLLDYIPQSVQKKQIDALIKSDGNLPLDTAIMTMDTLKDDKFLTKFNLKSKKMNLDVNLDLELNIEGGLKNLIGQVKRF